MGHAGAWAGLLEVAEGRDFESLRSEDHMVPEELEACM